MRTAAVLIVGLVATHGVTDAGAHDDHGETVVITGTVQAIDADGILLEIRDHVSLAWRRVWVTITENTRYKRGKARVQAEAAQITTGDRVVAVVTSEPTRDYSVRLLALQIELSGPRRRYIEVKTPGGEVLTIVITENTTRLDKKKSR